MLKISSLKNLVTDSMAIELQEELRKTFGEAGARHALAERLRVVVGPALRVMNTGDD